VYRRTIAGFEVLLCNVARPLYSSTTKTCCAKSAWFWICQCWCF